ncbi:hypothetical protein [Paraburkholderia sp.]|uniref:hypothetical protein n=1 Tax=Paraburkholderia sp. TaxID=1926495 RepID=UPI002F3F2B54
MHSPTGSVAALSSAAATMFSVGIIFLGYWGIHEASPWHIADVLVVALALTGFACLGLVPWVATRPVESDTSDAGMRVARRLFVAGMSGIWLAVALSLLT